MNTINAVFKAVKRDNDGFEDIQSFWTAADKLSFPLSSKVRASLFKPHGPTPQKQKPTLPADDSETEFNYDTSTTITDDEDDYDESAGEGDSDHDGDDQTGLVNDSRRSDASMRSPTKTPGTNASSVYSPLNKSLQSIGLSPYVSETSTRRSTHDPSDRDSILSVGRSTVASDRRETIESEAPSSSGKRSSVASRRSTVQSQSELHESGFDADQSNEMNDTTFNGTKSGRSSVASRRRASEEGSPEQDSTVTPAASRKSRSALTDKSLDLTGGRSGGASSKATSTAADRSTRRVSFGGMSPIAGDNSMPPSEVSRRTGQSSRPSLLSSAGGSADKSASSAAQSNGQYSPDDAVDDFGDGGYEEEPSEDVSRMLSQTDTPVADKSASRRSGGSASAGSSALRTPYSEGESGFTSAEKSRRLSLPTPGSHDFVRGTELPDETYVQEDSGSDIVDTDEEGDTSAVITPADGKHGRKHQAGTDPDASTMTEDNSFIDNSFLRTIHTSNKKYAEGRKQLQQAKRPAIRGKGIKHKLYSSDEEEEPESGLHDTSEESDVGVGADGRPLRRSRRATKGQRFAFWKNERPRYEEGTMVGLIPAEPTPAKKRRTNAGRRGRPRQVKTDDQGEEESEEQVAYVPPSQPAFKPIKRSKWDELAVYDHETESQIQMAVVRRAEDLEAVQLPAREERPKGKKLSAAVQAFDIRAAGDMFPGVLSGFMELVPQAIKDAEGVGNHRQVFCVSRCQPDTLELAIADPGDEVFEAESAQRMMLREGDFFYIPPGNIYRLENHSFTTTAKVFWTIVEPMNGSVPSYAEDEEEVGSSNATVQQGVYYATAGGMDEDDM